MPKGKSKREEKIDENLNQESVTDAMRGENLVPSAKEKGRRPPVEES